MSREGVGLASPLADVLLEMQTRAEPLLAPFLAAAFLLSPFGAGLGDVAGDEDLFFFEAAKKWESASHRPCLI